MRNATKLTPRTKLHQGSLQMNGKTGSVYASPLSLQQHCAIAVAFPPSPHIIIKQSGYGLIIITEMEKLVRYKLVSGCGRKSREGCILRQFELKGHMTLVELSQVKGFINKTTSEGDEHNIECWKGRGPCFDSVGLLVIKRVK